MTDSCPNCCERGIDPAAEKRSGDSIVHGYQCPSCGHRWATSRLLSAYSEIHRARERRQGRAA
ncbi:hypothetical protein [Streptomyces sp. NPDC086519]|uniref:hypothetical protein n=1 Tax=Streptomyces sp. NPDC086519 TaxID=3154863 RepID=UPI00341905F0